jgi:putative inorganic carbon (HCO3(-)) transporter
MSNIKNSYTFRIFNFLFSTSKPLSLEETKVFKFFGRVYFPFLTDVFLFLSLLYFWYEGLIIKYVPNLNLAWLAPSMIILALLFANKSKIKIYKTHLWYLIFLLVSLISGLFGISRGIDGRMVFIGWLLFAQFGMAFIAAQTIKDKYSFLKGLILAALPLAIIGIYQFFSKVPTSKLWLSPGEELTRVFAFFGSPNVFGAIMAIACFVTAFFFLKEKKKYWLVVGALFLMALFFTYSRSAWAGLALGTVYFFLIYNLKLVIYLPLALLFLLVPQIRNRLSIVFSANYINDSLLDGRLWSFKNGLYIFKKYWPIGTGPGTYGGKTAITNASPIYHESLQNGYTALYYTDNQFLEILVQTGIFGIFSFIGFLASGLAELTRKARNRDIISLTGASILIVFIVSGLFGNVLEFGAVAIPVALVTGAAFSSNRS